MIVDVAISIKDKVWSLPKPNRHHHVLKKIVVELGFYPEEDAIEGFLDDRGQFLDREQALIHAKVSEQLLPEIPIWAEELNSENLW